MLDNYKEILVEIQGVGRNTLGTAFYIGNNYFLSSYHCIRGQDSNLVVFFSETEEAIRVSVIQWDESSDIVLLQAYGNVGSDRHPLTFVGVEELYPGCEFCLTGFGDRENYKAHVPAPAHGLILNTINNESELDLEGSGLYVGMSGAPLIVGEWDNPMVAGMLKLISIEENGFISQTNGANRGIAISTKLIFDFLAKCDLDIIHYYKDSRKAILDALCECLKNKGKCVLIGIKGIGKYFLLKKAIKFTKKRHIIELSGKNENLSFLDFIKNPKISTTFDIVWEIEEKSDLSDYINNVISSDFILSESIIVLKYYTEIAVELLNFLSTLNISVVILTDSTLNVDFNWLSLSVEELNRHECSQLVRNFSVGKRINRLPYARFTELSNNIYFTCGGIPLLIKWICAEINLGKGTEKTILSKMIKSTNDSIYFQYLDGIFEVHSYDESFDKILCAIAISVDGISKKAIQFITGLCEDRIDNLIECLVSRGLVFDNDEIDDAGVLYSTYQIVFNYLMERKKELVFLFVKKYINFYSDYAKKEDFDAIPLDILWEYFIWSEKYRPELFIEWMYAFSYYFFETGKILERKDIGVRAEKICSSIGDEKNRLWCVANEIAYIDYVQGNYFHAERLLTDNISAAEELAKNDCCENDRFSGAFILSLFNRYLGLVLGRRHKFEEAYSFLEKSKEILSEIGRNSVRNNVSLEIGELLLRENKYSEAYKCLDECKVYYENRYKKKPWMISWLARSHLDLAKYFFYTSNYVDMANHLNQCSELLEIKGSVLINMEYNLFLGEVVQNESQRTHFWEKAKKIAYDMGVSIDKVYDNLYKVTSDRLVIVLTKYPYSGRAKTRLIHDIGFDKASKIATALLQDVVEELEIGDYDLLVCPPMEDIQYANEFQKIIPNARFSYVFEGGLRGGDSNTFERIEQFFNTYKEIALVYSDTPFVQKFIIEECFKLLETQDVVIGSDGEGGYYMVGMKDPYDIFTPLSNLRIPYLTATLQILDRIDVKYSVIHPLKDLDTVHDIKKILWEEHVGLWEKTYKLLKTYELL